MINRGELTSFHSRFLKQVDGRMAKRQASIPLRNRYKLEGAGWRQRRSTEAVEDKVQTILHLDPDFYRAVDGRPITSRAPMFNTIRHIYDDILRIKQQIAYRQDCILNIDENHKREVEKYKASCKRCSDQAKSFEAFIAEDYEKSMKCLRLCEEMRTKVDEKDSELQVLANRKFTITSRLIGLEYKLRVQQRYGRFLYYLSPLSWRAHHRDFARSSDLAGMGFDLGDIEDEDTFSILFSKLQRECEEVVKPVLFFSEPQDLIHVFERVEKQLLHHFTHVAHLAPITKKLHTNINIFKKAFIRDSVKLQNLISDSESDLEFHEERSAFLEAKFFKILHGVFFESVASTDVLKLLVNLRFGFEQLTGEEPMAVELRSIFKYMELFYLEYCMKLETLTGRSVKAAIRQCLEEDRRRFHQAGVAARELRLFDRMKQQLSRSIAAPAPPRPPPARGASMVTPAASRASSRLVSIGRNRSKKYVTMKDSSNSMAFSVSSNLV
ncbi:hypothetical protein JYU34_021301 [Plutella xylostella]|uniref:Uncharacterized protein n=1 Tax=Plutella xylostella TaxID=51655 RepID=A0ABQ7PTG9_PLUXY|nr:hypothetical protein JYU34_021301 [Plutella xylostella]